MTAGNAAPIGIISGIVIGGLIAGIAFLLESKPTSITGPDGKPAIEVLGFTSASHRCPNGYDLLAPPNDGWLVIRCKGVSPHE